MFWAAICDDDANIVDEIEKCITRFGNLNNLNIKIQKFYDGESLVKSGLRFDIVFLDIMIKQLDGIETGKILKDRDMKTQIVYITSFSDFSMRAHKVHAFDYLEKPITFSRIADVLTDFRKLHTEYNHITVDYIRVKRDDGVELLMNTEDIFYFEYSESRKVMVYTKTDKIKIKDMLYEIYGRLNHLKFVQPHKAYIVNLNYVKLIEKGSKYIHMTNGAELPLSQRKQKEFKEKLHKFMRV